MTKKVGIPRALLFYQDFPLWKTFFEELGAEVVVSPPTNKAMLANGSSRVVAETCLPTKVFCGHVAELADKVDYIFVPSVRSIEPNVYNCSKFLGLPDLVRNAVPDSPLILDIEIDVNKGEKTVRREIHTLGHHFTSNPFVINKAYEAGLAERERYVAQMQAGNTLPTALSHYLKEKPSDQKDSAETTGVQEQRDITVAIVGHPYNIYDTYINHNLVGRLRKLGARVVSAEMAPAGALDAGTVKLVKRPYWTYEDEVVGAAGHYLNSDVDGVLGVVCFGCGPDSMMLDVVQRAAKSASSLPLTTIVIDEHTGEAGLVTRLEAFVDMLERRKKLRAAKA
jgi:predicted nucleotide-binding protein (sugar kinase/HSP70/actin superfamily)